MDMHLYQENVSHGSKDFPLEVHYSYYNNSENVLYLHWHREFEFFYLENGYIVMYINGEAIELKGGEGVFINSNQLHNATLTEQSPCSFYAIVFDSSFLSPLPNDLIYYRFIEPIINHRLTFEHHFTADIIWQAAILESIKNVIKIYQNQSPGFQLLIKSEIFKMWSLCVENGIDSYQHKNINISQSQRIINALEYIQKNYSQKIVLTELAKTIHLSTGQFCRFFKSVLHVSPFTYIKEYRIQQSCVLIRSTDKRITEIAGLVGFDNTSYFNKTFLSIMKCTPLEYRRR